MPIHLPEFFPPAMTKKHARITAEDLWKVQRPSSPSLSPDGAQACVAVTRKADQDSAAIAKMG